jgi:hypothetical protein
MISSGYHDTSTKSGKTHLIILAAKDGHLRNAPSLSIVSISVVSAVTMDDQVLCKTMIVPFAIFNGFEGDLSAFGPVANLLGGLFPVINL